jgi:type VI secretion system secreted protein VgrG
VRIFRVGGDYSTTTSNLVRIVVGKKGEVPIEHQSVFTIGASTLIVAGPLVSQVRHATVSVGGLAVVQVAGAQTVHCEKKFSISAKGGLGEGYGPRTVKVDGAYFEGYRKGTWHVKGDAKITGTEVAIEAKTKLTIKADGLTIEMTPSSIEVQGEFEGMTASVEEGNHKYG